MAHKAPLEERIATLEKEVAQLKQQLRQKKLSRDWVKGISGSLRGFPEFAEVVRLGKEFRRKQKDSAR
jgi:hypothetical protein